MSPNSTGTPFSPNAPPYTAVPTKEEHEAQVEPVAPKEEKRTCGMKKRTFMIVLIALILLLVLGIALGVGLGVGLKKKSSSSTAANADPFCVAQPELCIGGSLDQAYFSKKGAFNGSGIALAGESWNKGQKRIFTLYFQHWSGDIRYMTYDTNQNWGGGSSSETVASDAKNATPISAVAYTSNDTQYFHLFYINKDNNLAQRTQDNVTGLWSQGLIGKLNLPVYDSPSVGLQACYKGNFYGDADTHLFPGANGNNQTLNNTENGMNIWYATDDSTFQQYTWYPGQDQWQEVDKWQGKNTHAGVGCYSWDQWSTSTYTMMVNKDNNTEFWWKDTNSTEQSTSSHPINSWNNASIGAIDGVYPATSMGYTTFFYTQMADKSIKGYNISYESENTHVVDENTFTITNPGGPAYGLGGTHMTCTAYAMTDDKGNTKWDSLYVFYQTAGDDITAFTRNIDGGQWSSGALTIPDD
ncbi:hypothetical protein K491DRAFT_584621 [Lophiostoma macrostomum CBS 122681]|uniref:Fucose-specific lectin n=1 Tax=Lophiostoma macrostomum CBS 122681 TaxID=1314788 RepID=A0A6A6TRT7_9PLEO|nr:hypothetical protein K491DRAFT_584621 [Lophiostoma macrostomum CBS 122681]